MVQNTELTAIKCLGVILALTGCGELGDGQSADVDTITSALTGDAVANANGTSRVVTVDGTTIDQNNPFFQSLGTNGRACVNCHQPTAGMTITPPQIQAVFNTTGGTDPVFRLNDGANGPNAPVATLAQKQAAYSLLLSKGLIRIGLTLPANRDFDVQVVLNPYASAGANPPQNTVIAPTATPELSFYRRPLLSANTRFISAVMWDGREATVSPVPANPKDVDGSGVQAFQADAPVRTNMLTQANDATRGHAQGAVDLTAAQQAAIVDFQMNLVVAQETDSVVGLLNQAGATGGPQALRAQQTFFGINDSHGGNPFGTAFNPSAMTMFAAWAGRSGSTVENRRASIARGEAIFNTHTIRITGVRGVNDVLQGNVNATLNGTCTTCHTHPNVGNHTDILPLDIGISNPAEGDNVLPVFKVTCRATGVSEEVTDLGRAMITGKCADLAKMKGPTLRALSARAPYFHNGAADSIDEVISFYDRRFHIGFTSQEVADLKAFLQTM
jgi:cytochrome c peroxidase